MPDAGTISPGLYDMGRPLVDGPSWDTGRISCLAYEVKRGTKPVAEITVPLDRVPIILEEIKAEDLFFHVSACGTTHANIFLCIHSHLLDVVKHLNGEEDKDACFAAWAWGKAFGYSEAVIAEFISNLKKNNT